MNRAGKILCPMRVARKRAMAARLGVAALLAMALALTGCLGLGGNWSRSGNPVLYFESPEAGVEIARELLQAKDWRTLARYYDLTSTDYSPAELEDGFFFVRRERPEGSHPGVWRYRQPFHPAYEFDSAEESDRPDVWKVTVSVEIDQGGGMTQRGLDTFEMQKSAAGWQLLPK